MAGRQQKRKTTRRNYRGDSDPTMGGSPTHLPHTEREEKILEAGRLDRQGLNQFQIAERLGVSQPTVSIYLAQLRKRYRESQVIEYHEAVQEKLQQYRELRAELYAEWERSKQDSLKVVTEREPVKGRKKGKVRRITTTREGRLGHSAFLALVDRCLQMESELLGLLKAERGDEAAKGLDWDAVMSGVPATVPDAVEERIKGVNPNGAGRSGAGGGGAGGESSQN